MYEIEIPNDVTIPRINQIEYRGLKRNLLHYPIQIHRLFVSFDSMVLLCPKFSQNVIENRKHKSTLALLLSHLSCYLIYFGYFHTLTMFECQWICFY